MIISNFVKSNVCSQPVFMHMMKPTAIQSSLFALACILLIACDDKSPSASITEKPSKHVGASFTLCEHWGEYDNCQTNAFLLFISEQEENAYTLNITLSKKAAAMFDSPSASGNKNWRSVYVGDNLNGAEINFENTDRKHWHYK